MSLDIWWTRDQSSRGTELIIYRGLLVQAGVRRAISLAKSSFLGGRGTLLISSIVGSSNNQTWLGDNPNRVGELLLGSI